MRNKLYVSGTGVSLMVAHGRERHDNYGGSLSERREKNRNGL